MTTTKYDARCIDSTIRHHIRCDAKHARVTTRMRIMSKTTKTKTKTKTNDTTRRVMTIAMLSRALKIDAKRARAKFRKQNVFANNDAKRHMNVVVSSHDANDDEHSLKTYCDYLSLKIDDVRATLNE